MIFTCLARRRRARKFWYGQGQYDLWAKELQCSVPPYEHSPSYSNSTLSEGRLYLSLQTNNNSKAFFSYFLKTNFLSFLLLRQMEPILLNTRLDKIDNAEAMENIEESKLVAMDLGRINWEQSETAIDGEFVLLINLVASRFYAPNDA